MMMAAGVADVGRFFVFDNGEMYGEFPGFGGGCTGVPLPTGAFRVSWHCPDCQFELMYQ